MKRVTRYEHYSGGIIGGVCAGLADYFSIGTSFLRFLWFMSIFVYGFGILLYIILCILLPKEK